MIFEYDSFGNINVPHYVLCKGNWDRISILNCINKKMVHKFNAYDEITFTTYMNVNNKKNEYYDLIKEGKFIELPLIGRYVISDVSVQSEATDFEYKECTALSGEVLLAQKHVENFIINKGTEGSIDGVRFYHQVDPEKSLLHLLLQKCPDWTIGHVDVSLMEIERCFEIDRKDIYSVLINEVSEAFQCVFLFDTVHQRINVYSEENVGQDTNIFISYDNLLKNTNISSSIEDIKTCLTVTGADDLNLREVNMNYDRIYNFEYFNSLEYMSETLYQEYNSWKNIWNKYIQQYKDLTLERQSNYDKIHEITSERMPLDDPNSKDWTKYGLIPLQEKLSEYEKTQVVMMEKGQADPGTEKKPNSDYYEVYLPCYNTIQEIKSQIEIIKKEISDLEEKQTEIANQMSEIAQITAIENNLSQESLNELTKYIREDELNADNYVVTETMTEAERIDMLNNMLEYGEKELAKVSQPILQFDSDILNLYNIPEFREFNEKEEFDVGNYIHIAIRDDYIVKARILTMEIDWLNPENFSVTFSNVMRMKGSRILSSVTEALDMAQDAATSVSMNSSYWNKANKDSSDILKMLDSGLTAAGGYIENSSSDIVIDDRGIFVKSRADAKYPGDCAFLGGGQLLLSDDNFKTVRAGLGRLSYEKKGVLYEDYGLLADFVIAGYIAGSTIEGNEIIGGTIQSFNYEDDKYGTFINLNDGTFEFNGAGEKKLYFDGTTLTAKGTIQAEKGWFGGENGFKIESGKVYTGNKSSFSSTANGVYIGTDGIKLGNKFSVTNAGILNATDGTFSGAITGGSIKIGNNFSVTNTGILTAKDGNFTGSITGSIISGGELNGTKITGGSIKIGKTYDLDGNKRYMLGANDEEMNIGDFNVEYYNGRYILQSYDEFTGISPHVSGSIDEGKLAFWAAWNSDTDYGLTVSQQGTVRAKDIRLKRLRDKWGEEWESVAYNLIELWDDMSGVKDRLDWLEDNI